MTRLDQLLALRHRIDGEIDRLLYQQAMALQVARRRVRRTRKPVAECGTDPGYFHHLRQTKDKPCGDCKAAHARAERLRVAHRRDIQKGAHA